MLPSAARDEALAAVDAGRALPSWWYTDPAVFDEEQRRILRRGWHCVTHTGALAAHDVAGLRVVLGRDEDGEVRGRRDDGTRVQVAVWGPMVWVNVDVAAPSFGEWARGLPELFVEQGFDVDTCEAGPTHTWEIGCNWKVFQDNTIECYHCPTTHPEFARLVVMDPRQQEMRVGARHWIHHRIPFREGTELGSHYHYAWVHPATYVQHYADRFDVGAVTAVAPDRIRFTHTTFVPKGTSAKRIARLQQLLETDATIHQDVAICHRVQAAHESGIAPPGTLLGDQEALLTHLYRVGLEMLAD